MSTAPLPSSRNLEFYRKQAKALLNAARTGDPSATGRLRRFVPRLQAAGGPLAADVRLYDAQLAIARENGFASWPQFRADVIASQRGEHPRRFRAHVRDVGWYDERVAGVLSVHREGLPQAFDEIRQHHPLFTNATDEELRAAAFTEEDARAVIAREHGFGTWDELRAHVRAIESGSRREPFSEAFEAIKLGDAATVFALLQNHPDLLNAQGSGGSSMLNLAVSMQQPAICRLLIDRGADVDLATARGVTPLHAAAYGNQPEVIGMLIDAGASPEMSAYGDGGTPLVTALFWGHDEAREALVRYAITPMNLRVAAGIGRFDLGQALFLPGGGLREEAFAHRGFYRPNTGWPIWTPTDGRQEVLDEALTYASRNGQLSVLELLVANGADVNSVPYRGTAAIWAAWNGRADVLRWLVAHGARLGQQATFGGLQHGAGLTALHAAAETGRLEIVKLLVELGADPGIHDDLYHATASDWAEQHGRQEVKEYLLSKTAN